ncbi:hypothetical protein WAT24_12735 [Fulvimonas yonginensis]|uniref:Uncharacterized protein n=1 Tax=Fulvimonas yonginensis TaxID=1495200 RepID=A0ABU8JDG8_9GAMM
MLVGGCDHAGRLKAVSSPAEEKLATHYIDLLRAHRYGQIEQDMDRALQTPALHEQVVAMARILPAPAPLSVKLVGVTTFEGSGLRQSNHTFEYQYPDRWLLINVAVQRKDGAATIVGFHVQQLTSSLEEANRFRLAGKSPLHYLVLTGAVLVPLLCLFALVACIRTPLPHRKWLWILFILLGVCSLSINWTTGEWRFLPVSFQLFGAAAFQPAYGPWTVSVSLPLGAIWFLARRKRFREQAGEAGVPPELPGIA